MAYKEIRDSVKIRKIHVPALCIFTSLLVFFCGVVVAEEPSAKEPSGEEIKLEELKPEPLGDLFAIKLLEKIIELEDALKYLAREVGEMNERLTKQVDEMEKRLTKLETAPPAYKPASSEPYTPPSPPQKRFEVGDLYLGSGFKGYGIVYETSEDEDGTVFTGEIENNTSAGIERVEFEIIVYDEEDKLIGFTTFKLNDIGVGETKPFEKVVKGPKAHWIKKYEIHHLRSS